MSAFGEDRRTSLTLTPPSPRRPVPPLEQPQPGSAQARTERRERADRGMDVAELADRLYEHADGRVCWAVCRDRAEEQLA